MNLILLFLAFPTVAVAAKASDSATFVDFDYHDLSSNFFPCGAQTGVVLGNFPHISYADRLTRVNFSRPVDVWTTFPVSHASEHLDDHGNLISRRWKGVEQDRPLGFYLKPLGPGKLVVQMAVDERRPWTPPAAEEGGPVYRFTEKDFSVATVRDTPGITEVQ